MQDNELFQLFLPIISSGLIALGYGTVVVRQSFVPTQFGAQSAPAVYCFKIHDHRYAFPERVNQWNTSVMDLTETQWMETMFQVLSWAPQDPTDTTLPTASDLANITAQIMASDSTRATLKASNVGILRIAEVTNPYFIDDKNRHEANPSFDFTLTHRRVLTSTVPSTATITPALTGI